MTTKAETGVMWPHAKKCRQLLEAGRGKKGILPKESVRPSSFSNLNRNQQTSPASLPFLPSFVGESGIYNPVNFAQNHSLDGKSLWVSGSSAVLHI